MKHNMQILQELAAKNGPLCVGLDTDPSYIPESILRTFESPAQAVLEYNRQLIKKIAEDKSACCFKVQIAYYEAMGLEGIKVYAETLKLVKESGLICISDIKRGDIAATAGAYARAHFTGDFETDIITINPYMGFDTLKPFTEYCTKAGKGIFVLLRTSNPGMVDIEQKELKEGGRVLDQVGNELERISQQMKATYPDQTCSPVGAVVGCTEESDAKALRDAYKDIYFLIPGYGAQGGKGADLVHFFNEDGLGAIVNSSRGIIAAYKQDKYKEMGITPENFADASRAAVEDMIADIAGALANK